MKRNLLIGLLAGVLILIGVLLAVMVRRKQRSAPEVPPLDTVAAQPSQESQQEAEALRTAPTADYTLSPGNLTNVFLPSPAGASISVAAPHGDSVVVESEVPWVRVSRRSGNLGGLLYFHVSVSPSADIYDRRADIIVRVARKPAGDSIPGKPEHCRLAITQAGLKIQDVRNLLARFARANLKGDRTFAQVPTREDIHQSWGEKHKGEDRFGLLVPFQAAFSSWNPTIEGIEWEIPTARDLGYIFGKGKGGVVSFRKGAATRRVNVEGIPHLLTYIYHRGFGLEVRALVGEDPGQTVVRYFPALGFCSKGGEVEHRGRNGSYWSRVSIDSDDAYEAYFDEKESGVDDCPLDFRLALRPIARKIVDKPSTPSEK